MMKNTGILLLLTAGMLGAQPAERLTAGQQQYSQSDFTGARATFSALLEDQNGAPYHPQALFWLARTEMALRSWDSASASLEAFLSRYPRHPLYKEALYEKGRLLYYMEDYENSLLILDDFLKTEPSAELTSNALFWMGEGAFALGRWEESQVLFRRVIEYYPASFKVEASRYRLSMIELKLREEELLRLLKWSHEEILNALDEFRRRERAYQQAIQAYQSRILELEKGNDQSERISQLEAEIRELRATRTTRTAAPTLTPTAVTPSAPTAPAVTEENQRDQTTTRSLQELRAQAEELKKFYDEWEAIHAQGQ